METRRKPDWLKVTVRQGPNFRELQRLVRDLALHTVCQEARCPNIYECWEHRTATFMILGSVCTRACGFCAVKTGLPTELDLAEPARVAEAVAALGLRHVVITSVARDDLFDGGASVFAETIAAIRERCPGTGIEVLIPDFQGDERALATVVRAAPDVLNHNLETVRRLTPRVRARARYDRSLLLLRRAKELARELGIPMRTKSGLMLGLGETREEVVETLKDLRAADCDIVTLGQYLQPTRQHLPVVRYVPPEEFREFRELGLALGFAHVESGPLVRSSYHAHEQVEAAAGTGSGAGGAP